MEFTEKEALIGSGPFKLEQYDEKDGNYLYIPNEEFFKGTVNVKELQFLNVNNRVLSLQNNEINAGMTPNYADVQEMENKGFDVIKSEPTGSAVRIVFNLEHDQLKDKELRQAIAYALNREELARKVTGGGEPIVGNAGVIPPDSPWYNEKVKTYAYDLQKADQILDELGYKKNGEGVREGLDLSVMVSSTSNEAQLMKEMFKEVGIELTIKEVDGASFTTAMGENKYDMAITGHIGLSGDPDFLRLWFSGSSSNAFAGRGKSLSNEEFHELANRQVETLDVAERKQIIGQIQDILAEELPTLVLYHRPFYFIHNQNEFDRWFNTYGGIADGIPLWENKAAFIDEN
jgi:peptide/nickel transport system substrate-binding protein